MTKVVDVKNENLHVVIAVDRFKSKTSCQMQTIKWLVCFIEKVFSHYLSRKIRIQYVVKL